MASSPQCHQNALARPCRISLGKWVLFQTPPDSGTLGKRQWPSSLITITPGMVPHTVHTWSPIFFSTALQGRNNDALFRDGNLAQRGYDTSSRYTAGKQQASTEQSNLFTLQVTKLKLREWRDLVPKVTHNPANRARLFRDIVTMFKHTYDLLLWRKGEGCWSFTKQLLKSGGKDACDLRSKIWSQSAWVPILALSLTSYIILSKLLQVFGLPFSHF